MLRFFLAAFILVFGVIAANTTANAKTVFESCSPCNPCDSICDFSTTRRVANQFKVYGWVQAGITVNGHGSQNSYGTAPGPLDRNLDILSGNSYLLMKQHPSNFGVNQAWLGITKPIACENNFDWGFQYDMLYGTDARFTQSFSDQTFDYGWGQQDYYLSIPQIYGELGYCGTKVRVGKFAANTVHEALPAVATFFNSHTYICYTMPLTYSGVTVERALSKKLTVSGGWVAGCQNSLENPLKDNGFAVRITYLLSPKSTLICNLFASHISGYNELGVVRAQSVGRFFNKATDVGISLIYTHQLNKKLLWMLEGVWYENQRSGFVRADSGGISQHLIYTLNPKWSFGLRGEWFQAGKATLFNLPMPGNLLDDQHVANIYDLTLGLNWNPVKRFTLRSELRYDWTNYDSGFTPFDGGTQSTQFTSGVSGIVKF